MRAWSVEYALIFSIAENGLWEEKSLETYGESHLFVKNSVVQGLEAPGLVIFPALESWVSSFWPMQDEYSLFLNAFLFCWNVEGLSNEIVYKISHSVYIHAF